MSYLSEINNTEGCILTIGGEFVGKLLNLVDALYGVLLTAIGKKMQTVQGFSVVK